MLKRIGKYTIGILMMFSVLNNVIGGNHLSSFVLHTSATHCLEGQSITFWSNNRSEEWLRINMGDGVVSPWDKRSRYSYVYRSFGFYQVVIETKLNNKPHSLASVWVFVWPSWSPLLLMIILLGMIITTAVLSIKAFYWPASKNNRFILSLPELNKKKQLFINFIDDVGMVNIILESKGNVKND